MTATPPPQCPAHLHLSEVEGQVGAVRSLEDVPEGGLLVVDGGQHDESQPRTAHRAQVRPVQPPNSQITLHANTQTYARKHTNICTNMTDAQVCV